MWLSLVEGRDEGKRWRVQMRAAWPHPFSPEVLHNLCSAFQRDWGRSLPLPIYPELCGSINPPKSLLTSHHSPFQESEVAPYCLLNQTQTSLPHLHWFPELSPHSLSSLVSHCSQELPLFQQSRLLTASCRDWAVGTPVPLVAQACLMGRLCPLPPESLLSDS